MSGLVPLPRLSMSECYNDMRFISFLSPPYLPPHSLPPSLPHSLPTSLLPSFPPYLLPSLPPYHPHSLTHSLTSYLPVPPSITSLLASFVSFSSLINAGRHGRTRPSRYVWILYCINQEGVGVGGKGSCPVEVVNVRGVRSSVIVGQFFHALIPC